jgi:hypothetical protein
MIPGQTKYFGILVLADKFLLSLPFRLVGKKSLQSHSKDWKYSYFFSICPQLSSFNSNIGYKVGICLPVLLEKKNLSLRVVSTYIFSIFLKFIIQLE